MKFSSGHSLLSSYCLLFVHAITLAMAQFNFGKLGESFQNLGNDIGRVGSNIGSELGRVGSQVGNEIGKVGSQVGSEIGRVGSQVGNDIGQFNTNAYQDVSNRIGGIGSSGTGAVTGIEDCQWVGTSPFCSGHCDPGWIERARDSAGNGKACLLGYKAYCCEHDEEIRE